MTDIEERCRSQELEIYRLRAELAQTQKRVSDLQRIVDAAQRYIRRIEAKLDPRKKAESHFKEAGK